MSFGGHFNVVGADVHGSSKPEIPRPRVVTSIGHDASYLTFQSFAFQVAKNGTHNHRQFNALCGDNPPTIMDGYGKWTVVDRPMRQGLTIPTGFNPAKLKIEIRMGIWDGRFGKSGWDTGVIAAAQVENDIDDLHWMAGGNAIGGPSPVIYVASYLNHSGKLIQGELVPRQYWNVPWIISEGIEWGTSLRNRTGSRIYQDASFTLMGYSPAKGSSPIPRRQTSLAGGYFTAIGTRRTARSIAAASSSRAPEALIEVLAKKICKSPRNNPCQHTRIHLSRRSIDWLIPVHTKVWVPAHQV